MLYKINFSYTLSSQISTSLRHPEKWNYVPWYQRDSYVQDIYLKHVAGSNCTQTYGIDTLFA
jgi:hypothetical protein